MFASIEVGNRSLTNFDLRDSTSLNVKLEFWLSIYEDNNKGLMSDTVTLAVYTTKVSFKTLVKEAFSG